MDSSNDKSKCNCRMISRNLLWEWVHSQLNQTTSLRDHRQCTVYVCVCVVEKTTKWICFKLFQLLDRKDASKTRDKEASTVVVAVDFWDLAVSLVQWWRPIKCGTELGGLHDMDDLAIDSNICSKWCIASNQTNNGTQSTLKHPMNIYFNELGTKKKPKQLHAATAHHVKNELTQNRIIETHLITNSNHTTQFAFV